jgi:hypothetical protein
MKDKKIIYIYIYIWFPYNTPVSFLKYTFSFDWHIAIAPTYVVQCDISVHVYKCLMKWLMIRVVGVSVTSYIHHFMLGMFKILFIRYFEVLRSLLWTIVDLLYHSTLEVVTPMQSYSWIQTVVSFEHFVFYPICSHHTFFLVQFTIYCLIYSWFKGI